MNDIDICLAQETFLKKGDGAKIKEINDLGFKIYSEPRKGRNRGGLAALYKPCITLKINRNLKKFRTFEQIETTLNTNIGILRLVNIYRPPYSKTNKFTIAQFIPEFEELLEDLICKPGTPLLFGDFNLHVEDYNDIYVTKFLQILDEMNFQLNTPMSCATQLMGGTLDLILTPETLQNKILNCQVIEDELRLSDHKLVFCECLCEAKISDKLTVHKYRDFSKIDIEKLKRDINSSNLSKPDAFASIDQAVKCYNITLNALMDKHCPIKVKQMSLKLNSEKKSPWFDKELAELRRKVRITERRNDKNGTTANKNTYKVLYKKYCSLIKLKRKQFHQKDIYNKRNDVKKLFKKVNSLIGKPTVILPEYDNELTLANNFKEFFSTKIKKIRENIIAEQKTLFSKDQQESDMSTIHCTVTNKFNEFREITASDLKNFLVNMSNSFNILMDPVPKWLIVECFNELHPILLYIINQSLMMGYFPSGLKTASVRPTIKDYSGDVDSLSNYRPISNLPFLSKLLEKIVLHQLNLHLVTNQLYSSRQSGYRKHHSCETLTIKLVDDILKHIENNQTVALIMLDFSAAFETIEHLNLLNKLEKCFGITGLVLKWFSTYLKSRSFNVVIGDTLSELCEILFGVPQGSILGPILFILYIKDLELIAHRHGLHVQLYADDTQLYISFEATSNNDINEKKEIVQSCLKEIKHWMCFNFLKLNEDKSKVLLIDRKININEIVNFDLYMSLNDNSSNTGSSILNNNATSTKTVIKCSDTSNSVIKNLGLILDSQFSMKKHVANVKKSCFVTLSNLYKISSFLDENLRLILVKQLILSKLDYHNGVYCNLPKFLINELQKVLNAAIRFIYNVNRREHITPYIVKSQLLPVESRIDFKICLFVHNCLHGNAPSYLCDLIECYSLPISSLRLITDCRDPLMLKTVQCNTNYGKRAFSMYAPYCWNALPFELRSIESKLLFKSYLKTYYLDKFIASACSS